MSNRSREESPLEVTLRLCKGFDIEQSHMRVALQRYIQATEEMRMNLKYNKIKGTERMSEASKELMIRSHAEQAASKYIMEHGAFYR